MTTKKSHRAPWEFDADGLNDAVNRAFAKIATSPKSARRFLLSIPAHVAGVKAQAALERAAAKTARRARSNGHDKTTVAK